VGEHLEKVMPLVIKYSRVDDDELREYCIQALESFVRRCPKHVSPHIHTIIKICLEYLVYDPNYNYDDDHADNSMELDQEEEEAGASDDEYSDDDDLSWKVRRASAKCLAAVVGTRHEMLREFYHTISPALIARFKEREENVKADIFCAYITLLKQTRPSAAAQELDAMEQEESPVAQLQAQVQSIVRAVQRLLREKSIKTRQGCFSLLSELVQVLPGALSDHMGAIIPGIQFSLGDKNSSSNMKIDTLSFMSLLLVHHSPSVFHPHIDALVAPVVLAVGDSFYKITSEALVVTQQLVRVIRPLGMIRVISIHSLSEISLK
jgi:cullin-associated NEDD8-dissociated protein 1